MELSIKRERQARNFVWRQTRDIIKGGIPVLFKKFYILYLILGILFRKLCEMPLIIVAVPVVLIARAMSPFMLIRFGKLYGSRIGHFAINTELYLCERDTDGQNRHAIDILYLLRPICNQRMWEMWKRVFKNSPYRFHIFGAARWLDEANRLIPGGKIHSISSLSTSARTYDLFGQVDPHIAFTIEDDRLGRNGLRKMGIGDNDSFVCFNARTSAYLDKSFPGRKVWDYHDYRDSSIYNYTPAAEEISRRGYGAVRMGAVIKEYLNVNNPRIIDYAAKYRTDFLDIYLGAKCRFFISDTAGIWAIPAIFRRPIAWANLIPLGYVHTWSPEQLFIPKKLWLRSEHRFLTFREILGSEIGRALLGAQYEQLGIEPIENTPEEITALTIEMDDRLNNKWQTTEEDEILQKRFWKWFRPYGPNQRLLSRIGAEFLRENRALLE